MSYVEPYRNEQHEKDPEGGIHNPNLYACWTLKSYILAKASEMNEYNSEFFLYTDAGAWREKVFTDWPQEEFVRNVSQRLNGRMLVGQISKKRDEKFSIFQNNIQGGFLAGSKKAVDMFQAVFYDLHDQWLLAGLFIGKEQILLNMLALVSHKENIVRLRAWNASDGCFDVWFFYQYFFARDDEYKCSIKDRLSLLI